MSDHTNFGPNLHIAEDDSEAEDVGSPEYVTLADKLTDAQIFEVGRLASLLQDVYKENLGADEAVAILGGHINALVKVFEAVVPLIHRRLSNYDKGANTTRGATAASSGIQGVLGSIIGPAITDLAQQLPTLQGFLETVKEATTAPVPESPMKVEDV